MILDRDAVIVLALDEAPFALSLDELLTRVGGSATELLDTLNRLAAQGKVRMTADRTTRAYYTRSIQLK